MSCPASYGPDKASLTPFLLALAVDRRVRRRARPRRAPLLVHRHPRLGCVESLRQRLAAVLARAELTLRAYVVAHSRHDGPVRLGLPRRDHQSLWARHPAHEAPHRASSSSSSSSSTTFSSTSPPRLEADALSFPARSKSQVVARTARRRSSEPSLELLGGAGSTPHGPPGRAECGPRHSSLSLSLSLSRRMRACSSTRALLLYWISSCTCGKGTRRARGSAQRAGLGPCEFRLATLLRPRPLSAHADPCSQAGRELLSGGTGKARQRRERLRTRTSLGERDAGESSLFLTLSLCALLPLSHSRPALLGELPLLASLHPSHDAPGERRAAAQLAGGRGPSRRFARPRSPTSSLASARVRARPHPGADPPSSRCPPARSPSHRTRCRPHRSTAREACPAQHRPHAS